MQLKNSKITVFSILDQFYPLNDGSIVLIDAWAASINLISCTNFFFFYSSQAREKVVKRLLVVALAIHDLFEDEVSY